jgi:uncharacterized protein YdaU (DUF1376 family)
MTAEEVGQFLLLMIHAWLGGKTASLPNNPELLARYARCERVSESVMRQWPAGPDGRLYNETLSEEWVAAEFRSAHGARGAAARWNKDKSPSNAHGNAPAMPEQCPSNAAPLTPPLVKPYQSKPSQSKTFSSEAGASDEQCSESTPRKEPSPEGIELAHLLRRLILENNPNAKNTDAQERKWAREADRMMRIDKRTSAEVREIIDFSQADSFWHQNILSMSTLREKFDTLTLKCKGSAKQGPVPLSPPKRRSELTDAEKDTYARHGVVI